MLAEIFMLRCEAAARNIHSEHAANEAGARWVSILPPTMGLQRKFLTAWNHFVSTFHNYANGARSLLSSSR